MVPRELEVGCVEKEVKEMVGEGDRKSFVEAVADGVYCGCGEEEEGGESETRATRRSCYLSRVVGDEAGKKHANVPSRL